MWLVPVLELEPAGGGGAADGDGEEDALSPPIAPRPLGYDENLLFVSVVSVVPFAICEQLIIMHLFVKN